MKEITSLLPQVLNDFLLYPQLLLKVDELVDYLLAVDAWLKAVLLLINFNSLLIDPALKLIDFHLKLHILLHEFCFLFHDLLN